MAKYNLAIDIGSGNTVIYKAGRSVILKEPSIIAIENVSRKKQVKEVGDKAKKLVGKTNLSIEVYRPIEKGVVKNLQLAKLMLSEFLKKIEEKGMFKSNKSAVLCVPCGLSESERLDFKRVIYGINFTDVALVPSPICALLGMGVDSTDTQSHMVVNIGAGVTDVAVINASHIVSGMTMNIGGEDIDTEICSYIKKEHKTIIGSKACEGVKNDVASLFKNDLRSITLSGIDMDNNNHTEIVVFSKEVKPIIENFFDKVIAGIDKVLNECSSEVIGDINRSGIYLCGGVAQITGIEKYVASKVNLPVYVDTDPALSVIDGAGVLLNNPSLVESVKIL